MFVPNCFIKASRDCQQGFSLLEYEEAQDAGGNLTHLSEIAFLLPGVTADQAAQSVKRR